MAKAIARPVVAAGVSERIRLRVSGVPVHLVDRGWGLCLWWPYNEGVDALFKAVAKSAVLEQLGGIGAVRES